MKINAVISSELRRKKKSLDNYQKYPIKAFLLLIAAVISGVAVYIIFNDSLRESINSVFINHNEYLKKNNGKDILISLILSSAIYIVILLVFSTNVLGMPYIYTLSFLKIQAIAVIISHLYLNYGINGIEYSIIVFLPGKALLIVTTLILIDFSDNVIGRIRERDNSINSFDIKKISVLLIIVLLLAALSVMLDYLSLRFLSDLFSF